MGNTEETIPDLSASAGGVVTVVPATEGGGAAVKTKFIIALISL